MSTTPDRDSVVAWATAMSKATTTAAQRKAYADFAVAIAAGAPVVVVPPPVPTPPPVVTPPAPTPPPVVVPPPPTTSGNVDGRTVTATSVGAKGALTVGSGDLVITTDGMVVTDKLIQGRVIVRANNVVLRNNRIEAYGIDDNNPGLQYGNWAAGENWSGLLVEDTTITSKAGPGSDGFAAACDRAIGINTSGGAIFRRVAVVGTRRGIGFWGSNVTVEEAYIAGNVNTSPAHSSAIGCWGGVHDIKLLRSNLSTAINTNASSAVSIYPESAPNHHWTIDLCVLGTQGGYILYADTINHDMVVTNNFFLNDPAPLYGALASWPTTTGNVWTNNQWWGPGATVSGQPAAQGTPILV